MAEPKKETVRIALPQRPATASAAPAGAKRDTARIVLPSRTPVIPPRRSPPAITPSSSVSNRAADETPIVALRRPPVLPPRSPVITPFLEPLPKPPGTGISPDVSAGEAEPVAPAAEPATFENHIGAPVERGPKKETARISILPKPTIAPRPAVNMTKTQPLIMHPSGIAPASPVIVATSKASDPLDSIPRWFCWGLLGIAALIFLIQIWNYFSI